MPNALIYKALTAFITLFINYTETSSIRFSSWKQGFDSPRDYQYKKQALT